MDPEIGSLKIYMKSWDDVNETDLQFNEVALRECEHEDLSGESEYGFYPPETNSTLPATLIDSKHLMCIEKPEELSIYGDFSSTLASNLMVVFEKCDPTKGFKCKSKEEIEAGLEATYIVLIENK